MWQQSVSQHIGELTSQPFAIQSASAVGGGCINEAFRLQGTDGRCFFIKLNGVAQLDMFTAEAEGLQAIINSHAILAPQPLGMGSTTKHAYLILEHIELGRSNAFSQKQLGEQLAAMHTTTQSQFGWHRDNTIGSTRQINTQSSDWTRFWKEHRLGFQLELAKQNGYSGRLQQSGEKLLLQLPALLDHSPKPSLLHGDLWSGNYGFTHQGDPVIYDPALYYGDRETDLAMTELFGGFSSDFYDAYQASTPLDPGYKTRKTLYNLYHILNHLNLFGGGYLSQAQSMIDQLLSEIG